MEVNRLESGQSQVEAVSWFQVAPRVVSWLGNQFQTCVLPPGRSSNAATENEGLVIWITTDRDFPSLVPLALAVGEINHQHPLVDGHLLNFTIAETYGDEEESILQVALLWTEEVAGYIGPQETCVHEAKMASGFNLPMISYDKKHRSTINCRIRISLPDHFTDRKNGAESETSLDIERVSGDRYRAMITNFFIPELNNHDVQELWFQQDGATCHTARATIDLLKDTFGDRLISRFGPVNWPPRSCD
ncbi:ANF_receptor domain-containing protein [Trichonephila clavipes]|nr:ANF_receptor domain-containing protein [Trichonephila clavipes]